MASKTQAQKFINVIKQQIEKLKGERTTVLEAVDEAINQVQSEVDVWVNRGLVNQTTFVQMNNRIQQVVNLFIVKSVEICDLEINENESDLNQTTLATSNDSMIPKTSYTKEDVQERTTINREETLNESEEAVLSLKKSTEQFQENVNKKLEILTNANLKSKKKIQDRITVLEKRNKDISSNVDDLFETVTHVNDKLNRLEDDNKSDIVAMNELKKQISSLDAFSNDALMSIQDLSKSVESTNQHYNEMSNKMNQLEISMNLMSSQYTEKFENMSSLNKDKVDDLIGMVCQLLSKRLAPLEILKKTLNKKVILRKEHISKVEAIDKQLAEISGKVSKIESKVNEPTLLFNTVKSFGASLGCFNIEQFSTVSSNYGRHFDPSSGKFTAPLDGFYLISIRLIKDMYGSYKIRCLLNFKKNPVIDRSFQLCCVSDNECVTGLVELNAGETLCLQIETKKESSLSWIKIQFSCFMIK